MHVTRMSHAGRAMLSVVLAFGMLPYNAVGQQEVSRRTQAELVQQMQKFEKEGQLARTLAIGEELIRAYPDRYNFLWYLATINARLGNRSRSLELYDAALSKAPSDKVAAIQADLKARYGIVKGASPTLPQTARNPNDTPSAFVSGQRAALPTAPTATVLSTCDAAIAAHRASVRSASDDGLFVRVVTSCQSRPHDIAAESALAYGGESAPRMQRHFQAALAGDTGRYAGAPENSSDSSIGGTLLGLVGSVALGRYAVRAGADPAVVTNTIMNTVVAPPKEGQRPFDVRSPLDGVARDDPASPDPSGSLPGPTTMSPTGACPANLRHIAPKLPMYQDPLLQQVRQSVLNEDIAAVMTKIRGAGMTPSQGASRMLSDAKAFEEQAVRAEECVRAVTTTPEPILQSLRQGTFPMGTRGTIQENCAKSYVNAYYGAVGSRELAVVVACHASLAR